MRAFVGVGANLGDAVATVNAALSALAALPHTRCVARSSLYRSAPVEADGADYVNAVAELSSGLSPQALLKALQSIEQAHGRQRPYRHAPRTLDLDLLLFGQLQLQTLHLVLPHPRMQWRAFVLVPLAELDDRLCIPGAGAVLQCLSAVEGQCVRKIG